MHIVLRTKGLRPTHELLIHAQRRLSFALSRFSARIRHVRVLLSDENGPRGGVDKACRLEIALAHRGRLRIEDLGSDANAVIDRACERAARAVARTLARRITRRRTQRELRSRREFDPSARD